jgi:CRP-like cAMP-binding protein
MENLIFFLDSIYPLSPGLREELLLTIKSRHLPKKNFLLKPGKVSRKIYFIHTGLLRAFYEKDGTEVSSWFMKEGDICVSIESFYEQVESYESIQAIEDTELFFIDHAELENIYVKYPEFNWIGRVLTIKYLKLWSQQLYAIRMQNAAERYTWLLEFHPDLLLRVPHKYIASYLDITPETLSKIRCRNMIANQKSTI